MAHPFSAKLGFVLKALSMSRGRLAADLGVDKSAVGRWVSGAVKPSAHSLSELTALVAAKVEGFTIHDWDRSLESLAGQFGVDPNAVPGSKASRLAETLPMGLLDEILDTTARRGAAYEGFFRSTRPYARYPGRFIHDQVMIRRDANGVLRFDLATGGVIVKCLLLPLQNQLFVIGAERTSGALAFGIINGVNTVQAGAMDGLLLNCALDAGRTPTASAVILERTGDLNGDPAIDDVRFAELAVLDPVAPEGSVPRDVSAHLVRNIGPDSLAMGGDWLLRLPIARSLSRGLDLPSKEPVAPP